MYGIYPHNEIFILSKYAAYPVFFIINFKIGINAIVSTIEIIFEIITFFLSSKYLFGKYL